MSNSGNSDSKNKLPFYETLHNTALRAPSQSGVYMWRNPSGTVIYVGKAKNLRNRLSSYFSGNKDIKTRLLIANAASIEYTTTGNEYEAFLLENNLIKKYSPRYNICLKDGKSYPSLKLTREKFPRLIKTRNIVKDGSVYFGPYPDSNALETFLETLYEIYPLRHCRKMSAASPCMYYHIGRCLAPCKDKGCEPTYIEYIEEIQSLLEGKGEETSKKIEAEMKKAAQDMNFEKAARLRDGLKALSIMQNQNIVEGFDSDDRDYIAYWREGELISFTVMQMRGGKLLGRDNYRTSSLNEDSELCAEFMGAYYTDKNEIPPKIYVTENDITENICRWMEEKYGTLIQIISVPESKETSAEDMENTTKERGQSGTGLALHRAALNMAKENAHEDIIRLMRERGDFPAMRELQEILELPKLPVRIEGFDIAHIGGKFPVASLISFLNGNPDKKNYRYFRLKTTDGIIDDFASMREAASRRYTRLVNEGKELPDLILIDGGIGQVNAVHGIISALGLEIPIAGLAKRDEEIYRPGKSEPVCLPKRSDALRLLQRVRDETHRFATSRNQQLRTKENTVTPFLKLPHIGKERDKILMKTFGTLKKLALSDEAQVAQSLHVRADIASDILMHAKILFEEQKKKKEEERMSLGLPGTTKEKAARYKLNSDLASAALEVASSEEETFSTEN